MKVVRGERGLKAIKDPVVTLGNFDGLHLGHRRILERVVERARTLGRPSVVYTFEPHPRKVVAPKTSPPLITSLEEKTRLIGEAGVDYLVLARFSREFASKRPRNFVEEVLAEGLGAREVWVGHDFKFGSGKRGTTEYLKKLGEEFGFAVHVIPAYKKSGAVVSSSRVRELVGAGKVRRAASLLARPFSLEGKVVKGSVVGRGLGFPTANLKTAGELLPAGGVYAAWALVGRKRLHAVVNVGDAPTFKRGETVVETHILDFSASIYGKNIRIEFMERIRDEARFADPGALAARIERDIERARKILQRTAPGGAPPDAR